MKIKTRESLKTIKTFDRADTLAQKSKKGVSSLHNSAEQTQNVGYESETDYAGSELQDKEAKYNADDYYFEQELMDLFRPSVEHNQAWGAMLFLELRFYSCMPESYTKSVRNMVLAEEEAERNLAQANT